MADTDAATETTIITAPTEGEIKKVDIGEGEEINLDFSIDEAQVELVDVDLVMTWPDGSTLILVSYGITMLMEDSRPLRVQDEVVEAEDLLSRVGRFVESDLPTTSEFSSQPREIPEDAGGDEGDGRSEEEDEAAEDEVEPEPEPEVVVEIVEVEVEATATPQIQPEETEDDEGEFDSPRFRRTSRPS